MAETIRVAAVQMNVTFADKETNLGRLEQRLADAAGQGARLVVFPECAVTGYCFESREEAEAVAEPIPGPWTQRITAACRRHDVYAVIGTIEWSRDGLFNAAVLVGPHGVFDTYRKAHLPYLGLDRFATPGNLPFRVWDIGPIRLGANICYDSGFPEAARCLALEGADLIALPTNWPTSAECLAEHVIPARALENNIYYVVANRVGTERGFSFIGQSKICDPSGRVIAQAKHTEEAILIADVDPKIARAKKLIRVPGKHMIDRIADRRPDLYGRLVASKEPARSAERQP